MQSPFLILREQEIDIIINWAAFYIRSHQRSFVWVSKLLGHWCMVTVFGVKWRKTEVVHGERLPHMGWCEEKLPWLLKTSTV